MTIQLIACNTGVCPAQGLRSFAEQLATELCEDVQGANNFVWIYSSGKTVVAPPNEPGITWQNYTQEALNKGPNLNSPGAYLLFPKKQVTIWGW